MNLQNLNEKQREAVLAEGIIRVIAGAGSGKTRVLTHRIGYLVSERGMNPSNILAVTFTRKAAREMKERLKKLIGTRADELVCGTFHSVCYRILRESLSNGQALAILDERKRKTYLKKVLGPEGLNLDLEVGKVGSIISMAKNRLIDAENFKREADDFIYRKVADAFDLYEHWKDRDRLMDYDDLLLKCWKLLKTDLGGHDICSPKRLLRRYRQRFSHILVDEFQDTNLAQFEIVRLLTPPQNNLFVVGDDWQSIYGWRGAAPENIIELDRTFPSAVTIKLEQNYRSTGAILQGSGRLIAFNRIRTEKTLWTENPEGREVEVIVAEDADREAALIIERVTSLVQGNGLRPGRAYAPEGTRFKDISILYRTNAQSRALEDECIRQKIPYQVIGSLGFYDRREIKDMIAYLRLVHDLDDDEALLRIINVPSRYLGKAFVKELEGMARARGKSLFLSLRGRFRRPYMGKSAMQFQELILGLRRDYEKKRLSLPDLVKRIRSSTGYDRYICQDEEVRPDDSRIQNLNELEAALSRFERIEDFLFYVEQVKTRDRERKDDDRVHPVESPKGGSKAAFNRVNLMTLHKSKGLEFPVVFIAGCAQGLLPHHKALDDARLPLRGPSANRRSRAGTSGQGGLEEERRLCYVGMTRAMERLYISYPRTYQGKPLPPSQFLKEAFPELKTTD